MSLYSLLLSLLALSSSLPLLQLVSLVSFVAVCNFSVLQPSLSSQYSQLSPSSVLMSLYSLLVFLLASPPAAYVNVSFVFVCYHGVSLATFTLFSAQSSLPFLSSVLLSCFFRIYCVTNISISTFASRPRIPQLTFMSVLIFIFYLLSFLLVCLSCTYSLVPLSSVVACHSTRLSVLVFSCVPLVFVVPLSFSLLNGS